jgi:hypothetical protein
MLKMQEALIAWNPGANQIRVGPLSERENFDWTVAPIRYLHTAGAAHRSVRDMDDAAARRYVLNLFNTLVIRDKVDPLAAHTALCGIYEFASSINEECPGAIETTEEE